MIPYNPLMLLSNATYEPEIVALIAYATANSIPIPPAGILFGDNQRLRRSKASGEWADWDIFYHPQGRNGYEEYAKLNWKSPGNFTLTVVGTVTFDDTGFKGDGTTGYLTTGWVASTHAVKYTQNNASAYFYCPSTGATTVVGSDAFFGCRAASNTLRLELIPNNATSLTYVINAATSNNISNSINWTEGGWHVQRTSSTVIAQHWDNFQMQTTTRTSTGIPSTELYVLATNNNGTAINFCGGAVGIFAVGASQSGRDINAVWNPSFYNQQLNSTPVNTYVVSMHGQSNSEGIDLVSGLSTDNKRQFQNTYIWWNPQGNPSWGRWAKLKAGRNNQNSTTDRLLYFGAEIGMADQFEKNNPSDALYIIKYGVGNSRVAGDGSPNWVPSTPNGVYSKATGDYEIPARAALPVGVIEKGMIWMQGEEDAASDTNSATATFITNTNTVFSAFKTDLSLPNWPITVCRLNSSIVRDATRLANVRTAQGTASGMLCDVATYPYNTHFDTDSYTPLLDTVHFPQLQYGIDLYNLLF